MNNFQISSAKISLIFLLTLLVSFGCSGNTGKNSKRSSLCFSDSSKLGLKDYYKDYFPIGASIAPRTLSGKESSLIKKEFNSVTIEYLLQLKHVYKEPGFYNFKLADKMVNFARENHLKVRGHALCWHDQVPEWFIKKNGKVLTKNELLEKLHQHIDTMVTRYKDTIYAWDVVNEAISNKKDEYIEHSPFQKIVGDEYIAKAFEFAHQADSNAKLFYNDNKFIDPVKRNKIIKLIKDLKESNVPIHGIGIQGHWSIYSPNEDDLRETLNEVISLGLEIQITELDISIYPKNKEERKNLLYVMGNIDVNDLQAKQYEMIFRVLRDYKEHITGVTFWNVSDFHSWLDKPNQKHYPLLFDSNFERKPFYEKVTKF